MSTDPIEVTSITRVQPGDRLIIRLGQPMDRLHFDETHALLKERFPDCEITLIADTGVVTEERIARIEAAVSELWSLSGLGDA